MGFNLFRRKKAKKKDVVSEEERKTTYAPLDESSQKNARKKQSVSHKTRIDKRHLVDLCEEIIESARTLEEVKQEYHLVTSYLKDIQVIEKLSEEQRTPIVEAAKQIGLLDTARNQLLQKEQVMSDVQFSQMQEEENEIPAAIKRLKSNETYLDAIKRDLNLLEGEKVECSIHRQELVREQKFLRTLTIFLLFLFAAIVLLLTVLSVVFAMDTLLYMVITAFAATLYGTCVIIRYQNDATEIRQCDVNKNHAVELENHVKIKYVNTKNAVDYACEKYHVKNSYEFTYLYEQYQAAVREREKFKQTSEDLVYYTDRLVRLLESHRLYDARIWIHYCNALADKNEMVELKHDMILRRKKIREQMDYHASTIRNIKGELLAHRSEFGDSTPIVNQILHRVDELASMS